MKAEMAVRRSMVSLVVTVVTVVAALGACGGGDEGASGGEAAEKSQGAAVTTTTATEGGKKAVEPEVPAFLGDLDRVCTTQVGFPGLSAYEAAPGLHPVAFFEEFRGENFIDSSRQLPQGWAVEQDANYEDTSDLELTQLVACSDRVQEIPTGVICDFDDDGANVKLELVDAVYDLKIYAATTGAVVHEQRLEAHTTECPYIATFKKGDKTFVDLPSDDEYIAALKSVVAP